MLNLHHQKRNTRRPLACAAVVIAVLLAATAPAAAAQTPAAGGAAKPAVASKTSGLKTLFEAAWARQPEAQSQAARDETQAARREAASAWTAEPPALELLNKTDRLNRNQGIREQEIGLALPLWLPGERSRSISLAEAEAAGLSARIIAARLRTAAVVREAYWTWQRAQVESALAGDRVASAGALAADVSRRMQAGDLSRADYNQAEGHLAAAEMAAAEKRSALSAARSRLRALTGEPPAQVSGTVAESLPPPAQNRSTPDITHPEIAELLAQADIARNAAELARVQTRANPELMLGTTRERGDFADLYQQSVTVGLRIPFGSAPRHRAKLASALADARESEVQAQLARERLSAELESAHLRAEAMRLAAAAAERRAQLARETREFFDKSFRLGETDLPTRLRIELEAVESLRGARLAHVEHGAAVSALRQALGLLPE